MLRRWNVRRPAPDAAGRPRPNSFPQFRNPETEPGVRLEAALQPCGWLAVYAGLPLWAGVAVAAGTGAVQDKAKIALAELIAKAKAKPDDLTIGNPGRGSIPHLASIMVGQNRNVEFRHVPFGATAQAIQAVVNGDTMASTDGVAALLPLVKAGRLRALAVSSPKTMPGLEGIPLASETVPGMDVSGWFVLFAPKGTPSSALNELNAATNVMLKSPEAIAKMAALGNYGMGGSVADAAAFVKKEKATWAAVVRKAGIEAE